MGGMTRRELEPKRHLIALMRRHKNGESCCTLSAAI